MGSSEGGGGAAVLLASNRGPVSFSEAVDGQLWLRRGGGGLVSGLSAAGSQEVLWTCAALSDADRQACRAAPGGRLDRAGYDTGAPAVRMLNIDPTVFRRAYNGIANSTLWFVNHSLYDAAFQPLFDRQFRQQWQAYGQYNDLFAAALSEDAAPGARVVVQDYHLTLAPEQLRRRRPDVRIGHFSHTPWASPEAYSILPTDVGRQVLLGMLGADRVGFLTPRWAAAFLNCCEAFLPAAVDRQAGTVTVDGRTCTVSVHPLGVDAEALRARAGHGDVASRRTALKEAVGGRRLIVRIDRAELSKNIVRGLAAYADLLREHPEWREQVVHLVVAYPSRHDLPEYREYAAAVQRIAKSIEDEFATPGWTPVLLEVNDDFARSLAAYQLADVLVVNPIKDGMNLVAKEAVALSADGCALVLSREAGAAEQMGDDALLVNPFDVVETSAALHRALLLPEGERRARCDRLRTWAGVQAPQQWFADQLAEL